MSQAGFFLRLWGKRASTTERVPPSPIRLWRPPARPRFPRVCRRAAPARSLGWTGSLKGGFKSARGNCSARGVQSSSSMVRGARQGPGLDSGWDWPRGLAFPATLAKPQPLSRPGSYLRSGQGCQGAVCAQVPLLRAPRRWIRDLPERSSGGAGGRLCRSLQTAATVLSMEQRPGPLRRGWGGADALGAGV